MRLILALNLLLVVTVSLGAQTTRSPEGSTEFNVSQGPHVAKLILTSRKFVPSAHRIVHTKNCLTIDSRKPIGTDCTVPGLEIASMRLFIDGKEVVIPRSLYWDYYAPPHSEDRQAMQNAVALKFSDDLKGVFVFLAGGDGAGVYDVFGFFGKMAGTLGLPIAEATAGF